jgi:hypothetical protein
MGRGEESEGGQRFLAGILDVVAHRRGQHEHCQSDRDYGAVWYLPVPAMMYCGPSVASVRQPSRLPGWIS